MSSTSIPEAALDNPLRSTPGLSGAWRVLLIPTLAFLVILTMNVVTGTWLEGFAGQLMNGNYMQYTFPANLTRWDGDLERRIVLFGHYDDLAVKAPMFSSLARFLVVVFHVQAEVALFIISRLGLWLALVAIQVYYTRRDKRLKDWAVLAYCVPLVGSGYTWLLVYPEGIDLACLFGALYFLEKRQYALVSILAVVAVLTRPQSAFLVCVVAFSILLTTLAERGPILETYGRVIERGLIACAPATLTWIGWQLWISRITGIPWAMQAAQGGYGRNLLHLPWQIPLRFLFVWVYFPDSLNVTPGPLFELYQIAIILVSLVVLVYAARKGYIGWPLTIYSWAVILFVLSSGVSSVGRYALATAVPLAVLYMPGSGRIRKLVLGLFFLAGGVLALIRFYSLVFPLNWAALP